MTDKDIGNVRQSELDDQIFQTVVPTAFPTSRRVDIQKQSRPWHKPRKQIVRRCWNYHIKKLLKKLHVPVGGARTFRYFTLAGPDLLDIRALESVVKGDNYVLKWVGFSPRATEEEAEIILNQSQVRGYDWVDETSEELWFRLEDMASGEKPVALKIVEGHGPFHAINFDLCQNVTAVKGQAPSIFDALLRLIEFQTKTCNHDWLLFVTTKIEKNNTPTAVFESFFEAIKQNLNSSVDFTESFSSFCESIGTLDEQVLAAPFDMADDAFVRVFCLGFSKWLVSHLCSAHPLVKLEMQDSQIYTVESGKKDMLSLVYKCSPNRVAPGVHPVAGIDEIEIALGRNALKRTANLRDLDEACDDIYFAGLVDEVRDLLKSANYPAELIANVGDAV